MMFQDVIGFLKIKKCNCQQRAVHLSKKETAIRAVLECTENDGSINITIREQLNIVINKKCELLAVADFIEELQEKYFK